MAPENFGAQPGGGSHETLVMLTVGNFMVVFISISRALSSHFPFSLSPSVPLSFLSLSLSLAPSLSLPLTLFLSLSPSLVVCLSVQVSLFLSFSQYTLSLKFSLTHKLHRLTNTHTHRWVQTRA